MTAKQETPHPARKAAIEPDQMKQQVDVTMKVSLWLDATMSENDIAQYMDGALEKALGDQFWEVAVIDVREEAAIYTEDVKPHLVKTIWRLRSALENCARLLADFDEQEGEEGDAYREAFAALAQTPAP